tara:strand:+ start:2101 stop:2439 length:339 start_codon:yes stop_codon:yes gene_type:complete
VGDLIQFNEHRAVDPILRKGDVVQLKDLYDVAAEIYPDEASEDFESLMELEGVYGLVVRICASLPDDHPDAPGQAVFFDVALPHESGWEKIDNISIYNVTRSPGARSRVIWE